MLRNEQINIDENKVLFFDMDGTLANTDYANYLAYRDAIKKVLDKDLEYNAEFRYEREFLKKMYDCDDEKFKEVTSLKEKCFANYIEEVTPIEETVNLVNKYCKTNLSILVTNSRLYRVILVLEKIKLHKTFRHTIYKGQGEANSGHNKYRQAIYSLDIPPEKVIAFENEDIEKRKALSMGINYIVNPKNLKYKNGFFYNSSEF